MLTREQIAVVLAGAREYIVIHGWCRGAVQRGGRVCAMGAIIHSQGWFEPDHYLSVPPQYACDLMQCAAVVVSVGLPDHFRHSTLPWWNDDYATCQQDVIDAFSRAEAYMLDGVAA